METSNEKRIFKWVKLSALGISFIWIANGVVLYFIPEHGTLGDMFGLSTSLFTGLTIIGLIATIQLQREDIRIARASYKIQQEELRATRDEIKQQNETLKLQRFENTFFNLFPMVKESFATIESIIPQSNMLQTIHNTLGKESLFLSAARLEYRKINRYYLQNVENNILTLKKSIEIVFQEIEDKTLRKRYLGILFTALNETQRHVLYYHLILYEDGILPYFAQYHEELFSTIIVDSRHRHLIHERLSNTMGIFNG